MILLKYICSWSGGKDSTATIILAHELGLPLDIIIFSEVMFDKEKEISGEHPEHLNFMKTKAIPLFESWGYKVVTVRADKDYLDMFYHVIERPIKHPEHKGMYYGFPLNGACSIKRDLKVKPVLNYLASLGEPFVQYLGICADEPKRLRSLYKQRNVISVLAEQGYTQQMSRHKCEEYGLFSPTYDLTKRGGCWMCPYCKVEEHASFREVHPDAWYRFIALENEENIAYDKWNPFDTSLYERNRILDSMQ